MVSLSAVVGSKPRLTRMISPESNWNGVSACNAGVDSTGRSRRITSLSVRYRPVRVTRIHS